MFIIKFLIHDLIKLKELKTLIAIHALFLLMPSATLSAENGFGLNLTALDRYVREPDPNYSYKIAKTINAEDYKTFIVEMTSQKWLTEKDVNYPLWEHYMVVVAPNELKSDIGFLTITGGSKTNSTPNEALRADIKRAIETGTVVSTLYMVPNQP